MRLPIIQTEEARRKITRCGKFSSGDENGSDSMKYWEIIADRLHAEGWSYGMAEHLTKRGVLFCVDAHRDGKRFIVKADDLLTAFLSPERGAITPKDANGNATRPNVA